MSHLREQCARLDHAVICMLHLLPRFSMPTRLAVALAIMTSAATSAFAANEFWVGLDGAVINGNAQWADNSSPASATDILYFGVTNVGLTPGNNGATQDNPVYNNNAITVTELRFYNSSTWLLNGAGSLLANGTNGIFYVDAGDAVTYSINFRGNTTTWTKDGAGSLTLTSTDSGAGGNGHGYNGTIISGGTLIVSSNANLGAVAGVTTSPVTINAAGTLQMSAGFSTARPITINGGTINVASGTGELTAAVTGTDLNKAGVGGLTLTGAKTYTGGTNILNGRISVIANGVIPVGSLITQTNTGQLFLNATGVNFTNNFSISGTGFVESSGNASGSIRSDQSNTFSGQITVSGTPRIGSFSSGGGSGTNTISGKITGSAGIDFFGLNGMNLANQVFIVSNPANDYTGVTSITSMDHNAVFTGAKSTLRLGASNVIPNGASAGNIAFNGANANHLTILDLAGFNETVNGFTVAAAAGAQIINSTGTTSTLTVGDNNTTSTFSGVISNAINVTKIGTGALTLSGNNSYTGATTVQAGTLLAGANAPNAATGAFGNAATAVLVGHTSGTDNAALFTGGAFTIGRAVTVQSGSSGTATLGGNTNDNSTFSGAITLNKDAQITSVAMGLNTVNFSGVISGVGFGITKVGAGNATYSGASANTYSGLTTVSAGVLDLNKSAGTNAIAGNVLINGGTLRWQQNNQIDDVATTLISQTAGAFELNERTETIVAYNKTGGTFRTGVGGHLTGTGSSMTFVGGGSNIIDANSLVEDSHLSVQNGANLEVNGATNPGPVSIAGGVLQINAPGGVGLELTGGAITLHSDNVSPGSLVLSNNVASHAHANSSAISSGAGGLQPGFINLNGATRTFTVDNGPAATDLVISALVTNGGVSKAGAGTMTVSANNAYSGVTLVNAGELIVNGTTSGQGSYNVSGGRLGGVGTIGLAGANSVTIGAAGQVSPGHSLGITYSAGADPLTVGTLTVNGNVQLDGTLLIDLFAPAVNNSDLFDVNGTLTLNALNSFMEINGTTSLASLDYGALGFEINDRVDLVFANNTSGSFSNFPVNQTLFDAGGLGMLFGQDEDGFFIEAVGGMAQVPEPASVALWAMLGAMAAAGACYRQRISPTRAQL